MTPRTALTATWLAVGTAALLSVVARVGELRSPVVRMRLDGKTSRVLEVLPGGAAAMAGLLPGDRLLAVDGRPVTSDDAPYASAALGKWRSFSCTSPA